MQNDNIQPTPNTAPDAPINQPLAPPSLSPAPPKRKKTLLVAALVVIVLVVVGVVLASVKLVEKSKTPSKAHAATIHISEDGFEPDTLKINVGTEVTWKNDDTEVHRVAANPFPTHSELPSLDSKTGMDTNGTYAYKFDKTGTFHYHDEVHPTFNGTIIVE